MDGLNDGPKGIAKHPGVFAQAAVKGQAQLRHGRDALGDRQTFPMLFKALDAEQLGADRGFSRPKAGRAAAV